MGSTTINWWEIKTQKDADKMIGYIVYEAYTPSKVGKVIACQISEDHNSGIPVCRVRWLKDKSETVESLHYLNSFVKLIRDHENKAKKHRIVLKKAKEL